MPRASPADLERNTLSMDLAVAPIENPLDTSMRARNRSWKPDSGCVRTSTTGGFVTVWLPDVGSIALSNSIFEE